MKPCYFTEVSHIYTNDYHTKKQGTHILLGGGGGGGRRVTAQTVHAYKCRTPGHSFLHSQNIKALYVNFKVCVGGGGGGYEKGESAYSSFGETHQLCCQCFTIQMLQAVVATQ